MSGFVLVMGALIGLNLNGGTRIVVWVIVAAIVVFLLATMFRPAHPSQLTVVTKRVQPGSWTATIRVGEFPSVLAARPRLNPDATLLGRVELTERGVMWTPGRNAVRSFAASPQTWDSTWTLDARRVPGIGNQVQLDLTALNGKSVTLWLLNASKFQIG